MTNDRGRAHNLNGWTPRGKAKAADKVRDAQRQRAAPVLPDRENTLALGAEKIAVRRGGGVAKVAADELMMDALIARAMRGDLSAATELYARLDREEDAATGNPVKTLSPYMLRKYRSEMRGIIRSLNAMGAELIDAGLAEVEGGKLVVSQAAREAYREKSQAAR